MISKLLLALLWAVSMLYRREAVSALDRRAEWTEKFFSGSGGLYA